MRTSLLLTLFLAASGACRTPVRIVDAATDAEAAALLGRLKQLEGVWELRVPGAPPTSTVFSIGAGGSIVRETMMPGDKGEMTNVYHMDGASLVMTHYCGAGNQPRMRATSSDGHTMAFVFEGATDLQSGEHCMGSMTLMFINPDTVAQEWMHHDPSGPGDTVRFMLARKK